MQSSQPRAGLWTERIVACPTCAQGSDISTRLSMAHPSRAHRSCRSKGAFARVSELLLRPMPIEAGSPLPEATLFESTEFGEACPIAPTPVNTNDAARGKRIVVFGLPGAYTPTCSAQHVPGYLAAYDDLRKKGVDEVWCVSVNDGYVMAEWGRAQKALGKIRFLGDGNAELARKLGLDVELPGMGVRMRRFSMFVDNGTVKSINVEQPRRFEVSDAKTMLAQLG